MNKLHLHSLVLSSMFVFVFIIIVPRVPFPLHLHFTLSSLTLAIFLLSLRKRFVTLSSTIATISILTSFSSFKIGKLFGVIDPIPGRLRSHVVCKFAQRAVMPIVSAKQPGIFPHACASTQSVIRPRTFSNIYRILNIVALCVQQTVSIFMITPLRVSNFI